MLSRSIRHGGAMATATSALAQILACSFSRVSGSSFFESSSPRGTHLGSSTTAAATTGPASGPLPASSQPATGHTPRLIAARSRRKVGRMSASPSGRRMGRTFSARAETTRAAVERLMARWCAPRRPSQSGSAFPLWRAGITEEAQNNFNCSAARRGGLKWSVVSRVRVLLKPSFSQASSKRRPIIQATGPAPVMRVFQLES